MKSINVCKWTLGEIAGTIVNAKSAVLICANHVKQNQDSEHKKERAMIHHKKLLFLDQSKK
jgi:hypothetical protein